MTDDIFCKIIAKEVTADFIAESEEWVAFYDINPQAPVHVLVVPKKHIDGIANANDNETDILGSLLQGAKIVAKKLGIDESGYRIIINQGSDGGQVVPHLHLHILGGTKLGPKIVSSH